MRATNSLLAIIAILIAVNCYLTYRSALTYGEVPYHELSLQKKTECAASKSLCPMEWHLKGSREGTE